MKFDPEFIKKMQKQTLDAFPLPFPEAWKAMQLPLDKIVEVMEKHIHRLYENGGIKNVLRFRNECERERNQVQTRLNKNLPNDDTIHLEAVIHYYDLFIAQINAHKSDLIKGGAKPTYKDMKEHLKTFYSKNKVKLWDEFETGKGIADHLVSHLEEKFPKADKYPKESTIRKDWLKLTD